MLKLGSQAISLNFNKAYLGSTLVHEVSSSSFPDGLLHWFKAENNVNDELGVITATPTNLAYIAGQDGNAFDFSGASAKVDMNTNVMSGRTAFSVSFYFYNSSNASNLGFYGNWAGTKPLLIRKSGYSIQFYLNTSAGQKGGTFFSLPADNLWYHLAFTYDGNNMKMYLNGVVSATIYACTGTVDVAGSGTETIGACGISYFNVMPMDEVKLWDKALTQTEITAEL